MYLIAVYIFMKHNFLATNKCDEPK